jgi:hypothetical protein
MLKLRYDETTGRIGKAYQEEIEVPQPYLLISEEQNNAISEDRENIYFVKNGNIVPKNKMEIEQKEYWETNFFNTSLGWVRREPTLANGTKDNFLNNNLPLFAFALASGQAAVLPIAYQLPDFTKELSEDYLKGLQLRNQPITPQFISDCMLVKMADFTG